MDDIIIQYLWFYFYLKDYKDNEKMGLKMIKYRLVYDFVIN